MSRHPDTDRTRRASQAGTEPMPETGPDLALTDDPSSGNNLEKIRDILFGAQVRDHERRFAKLEAQLLAEASQLRTDLKDRFAALERYIRDEVLQVTARVTTEEAQRTDAVGRVTADLQSLAATLGHTAEQLRIEREQAQQDLRSRLDDRATAFTHSLHQQHAELSTALDAAVQRLSAQKTDRASLSTLFLELSERLSDDRPPPRA